jgi:hypothetical protein
MPNRYPRGKISEDDEGEIEIAVTVRDKTVIVMFGDQVTWLGMPAEQAIQLGELLIDRAKQIK